MSKRTLLLMLAVVALIPLAGVRWMNSRSQPSHTLGMIAGRLAECPDHPNCVSSQADNPEQRIDPIEFEQSAVDAKEQLEEIINSMPRSQVVTSSFNYLHAEFRSFFFGFVDDVEFAIDESSHLIHLRSSSRVGRSDLGVNRERIKEIRQEFDADSSEP